MSYKIYMEWEDGTWVSSLQSEFQDVVSKETKLQGDPVKVVYRPLDEWEE